MDWAPYVDTLPRCLIDPPPAANMFTAIYRVEREFQPKFRSFVVLYPFASPTYEHVEEAIVPWAINGAQGSWVFRAVANSPKPPTSRCPSPSVMGRPTRMDHSLFVSQLLYAAKGELQDTALGVRHLEARSLHVKRLGRHSAESQRPQTRTR